MWWFPSPCCCDSVIEGPPRITPCSNCDAVYKCYEITPSLNGAAGACCSLFSGTFMLENTTGCSFESLERAPVVFSGTCSETFNWPRFAGSVSRGTGNIVQWGLQVFWYTKHLLAGSPVYVRHRHNFATFSPVAGSCLDDHTVIYSSTSFNTNGTYQPTGVPVPQACFSTAGDTIDIAGAFCDVDSGTGEFAIAGSNVTLTHNT